MLDRQLADLSAATRRPQGLAGRVKLLPNLVEKIDEAQPELDRLAAEAEAPGPRWRHHLSAHPGCSAGLAVPADVAEIGTKLAEVDHEVVRRRRGRRRARHRAGSPRQAAHDHPRPRTALGAGRPRPPGTRGSHRPPAQGRRAMQVEAPHRRG